MGDPHVHYSHSDDNATGTTPTMPPVLGQGAHDAHVDNTVVAKVTAMAVLGLASLTLGLLPLKLAVWLGWGKQTHRASATGAAEALHSHGGQGGSMALSALLCFGGGVLMCTTFLHMLPEVTEAFAELEEDGGLVDGTILHIAPHLLMCTGFFLMYLVEELVHMYLHWRSHQHGHGRGHGHRPSAHHTNLAMVHDADDTIASPIKSVKWSAGEAKPSTVVMKYQDGSEVKSEVPNEFLVSAVTFSSPWGFNASPASEKQHLRVDAERPCYQGVPHLHKCHKMHHDHTQEADITLPEFMSATNHHSHAIPLSAGSGDTGVAADPDGEDAVVSALRGLLIVLALSVHELFEGLAVGLESEASNVWYMLVAVACHKLVIAFCIGVELVAMSTKVSLHVLYVATFALVSPLGIGVGILVTANNQNLEDGLIPTILQGLATGTLLYVVFFEILERQRACGHSGLKQYVAVLVGFLLMFGMMFIGGHEHHHHHDHDHEHEAAQHTFNYTVLHVE